MKKILVPAILAVAVAVSTYFFQGFSILREEGLGLFLNTPDYYRTLFMDPFPISHLIGGFLVQFYGDYKIGIAIVTAMVLGVYFISSGLFRRLGLKSPVLPAAASCTAWWFIAKSTSPATGVAILLISGGVLALLALFKLNVKGWKSLPFWLGAALSIAAISFTVYKIGTNQRIQNVERWSIIEYAAIQGNWDYLLKYATPADAKKNLELTPWALLALNAQGNLEDEITRYPVAVNFGLDYGDKISYHSALFYAILNSNLGCYNESVHRTYQSGCYLPHGTSFRTLRMLVKENYNLKDSLMVVKYCDILSKSTMHKKFVKYYREHPCPQRKYKSLDYSQGNPHLVYTKNQAGMLYQLTRAGIYSPMADERYRCYVNLYGEPVLSDSPENKAQNNVN